MCVSPIIRMDAIVNKVIYFSTTSDWFQINIPPFSTRAIILGHHGSFTKISQTIFEYKINAQYTIYSLNCLLGYFLHKMYLQLCSKMRARFVSSVFCICPKTLFSIFTTKNITNLKGIYIYPLK